MIIAARSSFVEHEEIPYVTDGLVAWWDGIWNAGLGVHDASATIWKNLAGGSVPDFDITDLANVGDNFVSFAANTNGVNAEIPSPTRTWQQEFVIDFDGMSNRDAYQPTIGSNRIVLTRSYAANYPNRWTLACVNGNFDNDSSFVSDKLKTATLSMTVPADGTGNAISFYRNGILSPISKSWFGTRSLKRIITMHPNVAGSFKIFAFRLYNRTLTPSEMALNHAADRERFGLP